MIVSQMVKESLKYQTECPDCKTSWLEMEKSLNEGMDSDNCYMALLMIRSCPVCKIRFAEEYRIYKGEDNE